MLKILKTNDADTLRLNTKSWVLVRTSAKSAWTGLKLPLTIGHHVDNDIFVNAPTMRHVSKILINAGGVLTLIDAQSNTPTEMKQLKLFGVEAMGPFQNDPKQLSFVQKQIQLLRSRELLAYTSRYPSFLTKILPRSQNLRVATVITASIVFMTAMSSAFQGEPTIEDLSKSPKIAQMGNITNINVESKNARDAYAKGATIVFKTLEKSSTSQYALSLTMSGLDLNNELNILINDKLIAQTQASLSCSDATCTKDYAVNPDILSESSNTLTIVHNNPDSSYAVKKVFFRAMEPATDEEKETIQQLLLSAERYFEERQLLVQNIKNSLDAINEVQNLLDTRTGLDQIRSRVAVDRKKIQTAFSATSKDLQFKFEKELQLGHNKNAIAVLGDLLKLYPDPTSKQYLMLSEQRKMLQDKEKEAHK